MKEEEGEANSETHIHLLSRQDDYAIYQLLPVTGKMHQLRVHMNRLGIPILNDGLYPVALASQPDKFDAPLKLLSRSLSFHDPVTGDVRLFESRRSL